METVVGLVANVVVVDGVVSDLFEVLVVDGVVIVYSVVVSDVAEVFISVVVGGSLVFFSVVAKVGEAVEDRVDAIVVAG